MSSESPTTSVVSTPFTMKDTYTRVTHTHNTSFKFNDTFTSTHNITCITDFDLRYRTLHEVVYIYLSSAVIIFGLIGNIASFYALHRMTSSSCLILKVLAIMDSIYLLLLTYTTVYDGINMAYITNGIYVVDMQFDIVERTMEMANAWVTVLLTLDRYMAVMKPFHAKLILTEKRIKLSIFLICVLSVSLHVHMLFEWEHISLLICGVSSEGYLSTELFDDKYHVVHHVIVDGLFRCAIPLTLLIILNSRMAMVIYKAQKQQVQCIHSIPAPVDRTSTSAWLYKHLSQ